MTRHNPNAVTLRDFADEDTSPRDLRICRRIAIDAQHKGLSELSVVLAN